MRRPRLENKCTNCTRSRTCRHAQGVVVWKRCGGFKPDWTKVPAQGAGRKMEDKA